MATKMQQHPLFIWPNHLKIKLLLNIQHKKQDNMYLADYCFVGAMLLGNPGNLKLLYYKPSNFTLACCHICNENAFVGWVAELSMWLGKLPKTLFWLVLSYYCFILTLIFLHFWWKLQYYHFRAELLTKDGGHRNCISVQLPHLLRSISILSSW